MSKKTTCPITREQFRTRARPVTITIGEVPSVVPTKEFSTGSLGWYLNGKTVIEINGTPVSVQIGVNLTITPVDSQTLTAAEVAGNFKAVTGTFASAAPNGWLPTSANRKVSPRVEQTSAYGTPPRERAGNKRRDRTGMRRR